MLTALLTSIQTSLGSKGFIVGSVFPVVIFTIANGLWAYRASPVFRTWVGSLESLPAQALLTAVLLAGLIVVAYLLSAVASGILETFEGKRWPASWFRGPLHRLQRSKLQRLQDRYWSCVLNVGAITQGVAGDASSKPPVVGWFEALKQARLSGLRPNPDGSAESVPTGWFSGWWPGSSDLGIKELTRVRRRREAGRAIPAEDLRSAIAALAGALERNPVHLESSAGRKFDAALDYLVEAIGFSRDRYQAERIRLFNLRQFRFPVNAGTTASSALILAPTTLGNISRTMHSYALNQYGFDLDVLWTRLQNAARTSEAFYSVLQDAKVQLDFFIACAWLAWVSTFAWLGLELTVFRSPARFMFAGIVGPLIAVGAYILACRAYSVFADVMRSGIDLFRFNVLRDLHLPLPPGLEEERIAWQELANVMGYSNLQREPGKSISVTYRHT